jgi:hypothetical protein
MDTQPEAVIACAAMTMHILTMGRPSVARAVWEDGFLDVRGTALLHITAGSWPPSADSYIPFLAGLPSLVAAVQPN